MQKLLLIFFGLSLLAGPICAQTTLQHAAAAYFSAQPKQALEEYIQISKETKNKEAFLNAAFIAMEQGQPKQAVDIMSSAYLLYPSDPEITEFLAEAYLADGQYENAERLFSLLETEGERSEFILIQLAQAQLGMGEIKLAKYNLQRAADGKNHIALSNYLLGNI